MAGFTAGIVAPDNTVALQAIGPNARAATFALQFGPGFTDTVCALDNLPPSQALGPLGSIFIDNTNNAAALRITFPDTSAQDTVPAGATSWMLAITGGARFALHTDALVAAPVLIQVLNVVVPPTGVQPVSGGVVVTPGTGGLTVPVTITQSRHTVTDVDSIIVAANVARKYLLIVNADTADVSLGFGAAVLAGQGYPAPAAPSAGAQGGGIVFESLVVPTAAVHAICAAGLTTTVVVLEGV